MWHCQTTKSERIYKKRFYYALWLLLLKHPDTVALLLGRYNSITFPQGLSSSQILATGVRVCVRSYFKIKVLTFKWQI